MTGNPMRKSASRKEWLGLAMLTLPTMLAMLDQNVVILALPRMTAALRPTSTQALWITDMYGFFIAAFLVTMGRVGDRIGHRRLLLTGATAFGLLSFIASFSTSPQMLITLRAAIGIAGATLMPSILALIREMFPDPKQLGIAMGVWSSAMVAGISLGPAVGGLLLNWFWWGSVFLIAVPVMLLVLATGFFLLPKSSPGPGRLDFVSVAMSLAAILPIIYGLTEMARSGWRPLPIAAIAVGAAFGVTFVRRQRRSTDPLLDIGLLRDRPIGGGLVLYLLAGVAMAGNGLLMTQHLQVVEGFSPLRTALWLMVPSATAIAGIQVSTQLAQRIRPAVVLIGGILTGTVGMVILAQVSAVGGFTTLLAGLCVLYLGISPVVLLSNQIVLQSAAANQAGAVGSLSTTSGEFGVAIGIAFLGSLATVFYRGQVHVPAAVPAQAAAAANESITRAAVASHQLPPSIANALLTAARETFNSAYTTVTAICAVLFAGLAVLIYATLRKIPPVSAQPQQDSMPTSLPAPEDAAGGRHELSGYERTHEGVASRPRP